MNGSDHPEPRCLIEPTTGRPILMAPQRQQRPMHTGPQANASTCPFCPGHEHETPPELDAVRPAGGTGWTARAFANKYPAATHHELIAEGSAHREQPCDLDVTTWRDCLSLWRRRLAAIEAQPGITCGFVFKNVGALAGASIAHNHTQIIGLQDLPPRLQLERDTTRSLPHCPWCATLATAEAEQRLVHRNEHCAVLVPEPPKLPHETWLLPRRCDDDFLTTDLGALADAMHALFTAVARGLRRPAFNMWLHRIPGAPDPGRPFHWHFELQPRTGQMAGLELGGDMYINAMPAATTAAKLRAGLTGAQA